MTIHEAITWIDEHKPNTLSREDKIRLLNQLDMEIFQSLVRTHTCGIQEFEGYHEDIDPDTVLLAPEPYDAMYLHWLESQVDYANGEYQKYNNTNAVFRTDWETFERWYNRTHMPKGRLINYF